MEVQALPPAFVVKKGQLSAKASLRNVVALNLSRRFSKQTAPMLRQNLVMRRLLECITNVLREKLQEGLQKNCRIGGRMPDGCPDASRAGGRKTDFVRQRSKGLSRFGSSKRPRWRVGVARGGDLDLETWDSTVPHSRVGDDSVWGAALLKAGNGKAGNSQ